MPLYEAVVAESLAPGWCRFDWWQGVTYDIDAPGRNHGLLIGSALALDLGAVPRQGDRIADYGARG